MRLGSVKRETHHRGYRIEGVKQGEGMLLSVFPTRPTLPTLKYSRFRTLRGSWIKAVSVVTGYIDEALKDDLHHAAHSAQRSPAENRAMVSPKEMRGSQLIGLNLIMRHRGQ